MPASMLAGPMLRDLFGSKRDQPQEPTEEELAAQRRAQLVERLRNAIAKDPAFQVTTVDGLRWICPFTGTAIEAGFGIEEPAIAYLTQHEPWRKGLKPKPPAELLRIRWALWIREHLREEPRLQYFGAGRWLNPLDGEWVPIPAFAGAVTPQLLDAMARAMAGCAQARSGQLRPRDQLEKIARAGGAADASGAHAIGETRGHTRVSGAARRDDAGETGPLSTDLDLAGGVLGKILSPMPAVPGWRFAAHYEPHAEVGGDLYEVQRLADGRWFVAIADVTGHGVQGAMVVVNALKTLRFALKQERDLVGILGRLNEEMKAELLDGQFITCFAGILDAASGRFDCVCAGHHPAVLLRSASRTVLERVGEQGPALGLVRGDAFRRALRPTTLELRPGDLLLQFTDGFTEAKDIREREFGELRLFGRMLLHAEDAFGELLPRIAAAARRFAMGTLGDDATLLAIGREPPAES